MGESYGRRGTMWYPLVAGWFILCVENSTQTMIAGVPHDHP